MWLTEEEHKEMQIAAIPLMIWMRNKCHPHVKAIVDSNKTEVLEGFGIADRDTPSVSR